MAAPGDAIVVGSGPNGLAAAIVWAQAGGRVKVYEAEAEIGGGARTAELTLPGFRHDVCSAVHPMAVATGFFRSLPLEQHGLEWIHPPLALAHPFDDGTAAVVEHSGEATAERLGDDAGAYRRLIAPVVRDWPAMEEGFMAPPHWPRRPMALARFGLHGLQSAEALARATFRTGPARALFAGLAAHSIMPLQARGSAAIGMVLAAAAHRAGWPMARGGSQAITDALVRHLRSLGGEVETGHRISSLQELPSVEAVFCDVSARGLLALAGPRLPARYRGKLERFRPGPGVFKLDYALGAPIPWSAPACRQAGTVHLGGTLEEICASERAACAASGARAAERPFVLLCQPSRFDDSRAPAGQHTAWAYCHVPNGSTEDMTDRIEAQIERFAPGFGGLVLARSSRSPADLESHNANLVGGDIAGGRNTLGQLLLRPGLRPYQTPLRGVYLCSASTPPGGGVHGLCGFHAARIALSNRT